MSDEKPPEEPRKRMVRPPTRGGNSGRGESVKVKTSKRRTMSSNSWLARQLNDPFVTLAKSQGYRARSRGRPRGSRGGSGGNGRRSRSA